ncbi:trypsin Inhibitor like cysteine rich domain protein [Oesophagostomum dentatum]|uniref:Trypsin Inhibitor like cysteine rich domain protein n=1 Tax=Oesophagostomum dentatum TaxID=61180 RepID=A0A0B1SEA0_OESDE|nr:trypsin Inhibitor like cysteine rich domain protein [Oesophagostomum dentatum]
MPKGICNTPCDSNKCVCMEGFYRNSQGKCTKDCFSEPCGSPHATRKQCGKPLECQVTCLQKSEPRFCKNLSCLPMACECNSGYVLHYGADGLPTCILPTECP